MLKRIAAVLVAVVVALGFSQSVFAVSSSISESDLYFYSQNGIYFYDTNKCGSSSSVGEITSTGGGYERLKEAVRKYGPTAMEMQIEWGTPWEVVLAQMQKESGVGTAGIAVSGADNNWLGITGSGDAGYWESPGGRKWAKFSSVEASIQAWAGTTILRNGYYDDAFPYLNPNNWNLEMFLKVMISHYAPSSDGNNEEQYVRDVLSIINGPIAEVRAEMGWLSSEDYAKQNNIGVGGKHPLGSESGGDSDTITSTIGCFNSTGGARLAELAVWMAWPDQHHLNDIKDEYRQAMVAVLGQEPYGNYCGSLGYTNRGILDYYQDCGHFVATIVRYSGYDDGFPLTWTVNMWNHMSDSPLWEEIPNEGNTSNLMPGDIFVNTGHIMMYIGEYGGDIGNLAQASMCGFTGKIDHVYFGSGSGIYHIFRYAGPGASTTPGTGTTESL